jgi:hypothetical protein
VIAASRPQAPAHRAKASIHDICVLPQAALAGNPARFAPELLALFRCSFSLLLPRRRYPPFKLRARHTDGLMGEELFMAQGH